MRITNLRVNHIQDPIGFDLGRTPTFSWLVEGSRGTRAAASRIEVTCGGRTVADTGWAKLPSVAARVEGLALVPRTRYGWRVSVRTDAGEETTSEPAWFETGKMGEPWQASWVTCDEGDRHPTFSRRIELGGEVARARLYACGLGLYEAHVDGARVGDEYLAPGTCAYDRWLQAQAYDVTGLVRDGSTLSITLGTGWYKGRFGYGGGGPYYGSDWRLLAELRVTLADGSEVVVGTDETWEVTRSAITFSDIYDGERRDDTLSPVPPVPARLLGAAEASKASVKLHDRLSLPVRPHETFAPTPVDTPSGDLVLDLGQNIAGTFRLRVHEPAGARIRLQFGELLQDGEFYRDNLRTAKAEYVYVSDGQAHELQPSFTYYGYRYVRVEGAVGFEPSDFVGVALYSDFDPLRGTVRTGSELVDKLVENTRWGMRDNFVDTATDCPQRDERMGWTGDAQVFSNTALYLGAPYAFYRKYLFDMAAEQGALDGRVPGVVPSFGIGPTGAVWGDATTLIPWNMYLMDGDPAILEEHFDAMRAWVDWVERQDAGRHDWGRVFQYGDWLALDGRRVNDRLGATDEGLIANAYWWRSTQVVADSARVLGRDDLANEYQAKADAIRAFVLGEYYSASGRCTCSSQTAYALSLAFGLGDRGHSASQLKRLIEENGGALSTGFVGTPLLCPALSAGGLSRDAYGLLLREEYPSWLFEVLHGATTVWERWNSLDGDGRITGIDMNSLNHYAYGAVVEWVFSHAAGLRPVAQEPGFVRAVVAPEVSWRLGSLDARLRSAAGEWRVSWECVDETHLRVGVTVPFGCVAEVELPLAGEDAYGRLGGHELTAGTYEVTYGTTSPVRWVPSVDMPVRELTATRATEAVLLPRARKIEFLAPADKDRTVREVAGFLGLDESRLAELDAALRALAE